MRMASGSSDSERGLLRVLLEDVLVAAHARVVIDIAGLGHADHRVDQQVGLDLTGGAERQSPGAPGASGCASGTPRPCASRAS